MEHPYKSVEFISHKMEQLWEEAHREAVQRRKGMRVRLKLWYAKSKNQINMTKFIAVSIILLFIVWYVDVRHPLLKKNMPEFLLLPTDVSKTFLSTLSGVFLTVTTFTFATILTVLGSYSSNFTPRVVQKFIDKPYVLSLIGIFIGGFFYTILSLFFLQGIDTEKTILAGTIGVLYGVTSMSYFVFFMQRVLRDMKGSHLIQDIYKEAMILVEEEARQRKESERLAEDKISVGIRIYANKTGYLFGIDFERLFALLKDLRGELIIDKKIGEYISTGVYIARLHLLESPGYSQEEEKDLLKAIAGCFLYSDQKNETYDYHHEITNLVEIALRGLSPGINDPNTAINCIRKISILIGKLFSTENHFIIARQNGKMKVIYTSYTVKEELYLAFYQIIHYGKEDPSVAAAILEGLTMIFMISDPAAESEVGEYFGYAYEVIKKSMRETMDAERIEQLRENFLRRREDLADKDAMREDED